MGGDRNTGKIFSDELKRLAKKKNASPVNKQYRSETKLCSNSYLAMRVAFFNEIDNLCINRRLKSKDVMAGISLDKVEIFITTHLLDMVDIVCQKICNNWLLGYDISVIYLARLKNLIR